MPHLDKFKKKYSERICCASSSCPILSYMYSSEVLVKLHVLWLLRKHVYFPFLQISNYNAKIFQNTLLTVGSWMNTWYVVTLHQALQISWLKGRWMTTVCLQKNITKYSSILSHTWIFWLYNQQVSRIYNTHTNVTSFIVSVKTSGMCS